MLQHAEAFAAPGFGRGKVPGGRADLQPRQPRLGFSGGAVAVGSQIPGSRATRASVSGEERWHLIHHLLKRPQGGLDSRCFCNRISDNTPNPSKDEGGDQGRWEGSVGGTTAPLILPSSPASQRPYRQICARRGSILPVEQIHQLHVDPKSEVPSLGTSSPKPKEKTCITRLLAAPEPSLASGTYK